MVELDPAHLTKPRGFYPEGFYPMEKPKELRVVGKHQPAVDGLEKVVGKGKFPSDVYLPNMLHAGVLHSHLPHAKIKRIDTSKAAALPGVKAVITYRDVPPNIWNPLASLYLLSDKVHGVGDDVAAVAAETEEIVEEALGLIEVEYEPLPFYLTPEESLAPGAKLIAEAQPEFGNVMGALGKGKLTMGDVKKGFAEADVIVEGTYKWTDYHMTVAMEPFCTLAYWEPTLGGKVTVWDTNQHLHAWRDKIAQVFGIPQNRVRVIMPFAGMGLGSRWLSGDNRCTYLAVLLSMKTGRPVRLNYGRVWNIGGHQGFHPASEHHIRVGVKRDGTLTALEARAVYDGGVQYYFIGEWPWQYLVSLMPFPNVDAENIMARTNRWSSGFFRGVYNPEAHHAFFQALDEAAEAIGMDPVDFYLKNHMKAGDPYYQRGYPTVKPYGVSSCGIREVIQKCAEAIGWKQKWHKPGAKTLPDGRKHGIGVSLIAHGGGSGTGSAIVRIEGDGTVRVNHAAADIGQGANTVMAIIAAEVLNVPYEAVRITYPDTDMAPWTGGSYGTRQTRAGGYPTLLAAQDAKQKLFEVAAIMLNAKPEELETKDGSIWVKGAPGKAVSFKGVVTYHGTNEIVGEATFNPPTAALALGCRMFEVAVDTETGEVEILNCAAGHDVGQAIWLTGVEMNILAGCVEGVDAQLHSEVHTDKATGRQLNTTMEDYLIATALDSFPIDKIVVNEFDPIGPFGAHGIGEPTVIPNPGALANAVYNAIGVRVRDLPLTPKRILKALGKTT